MLKHLLSRNIVKQKIVIIVKRASIFWGRSVTFQPPELVPKIRQTRMNPIFKYFSKALIFVSNIIELSLESSVLKNAYKERSLSEEKETPVPSQA